MLERLDISVAEVAQEQAGCGVVTIAVTVIALVVPWILFTILGSLERSSRDTAVFAAPSPAQPATSMPRAKVSLYTEVNRSAVAIDRSRVTASSDR
mgnify:CR=1 FL=1